MFRRRFLQINFLEGLLIFPHFRKSSKFFSEFWREIFGRVVTTALCMYIGTFWGIFLSFRKIPDFLAWFSESELQICGFSEKKFSNFASFIKIAFSVANESTLMKKNCSKNFNFNTFGVREIFSYFWGQSYAGPAKISLCMLDERFEEKFFLEGAQFFHHFRNSSKRFSEFWREISWQGGRNWILRIRMKISFWRKDWNKNYFFRKNCIAILLGLWEKKIFRNFGGMDTAGLSKLRNFLIHVQTNILTSRFFGELVRFS